MDEEKVRAELRAAIARTPTKTAVEWARVNEVSPSYVSECLNGGVIGPGVLKLLGLERVVSFRQIKRPLDCVLSSDKDMSIDENCRQALFELDHCRSDFDFTRWAQSWGRPFCIEAHSGSDHAADISALEKEVTETEEKADDYGEAITVAQGAIDALWDAMTKDETLTRTEIKKRLLEIGTNLENAL